MNIKQVENGAGRHMYYLKPSQITEELKWHAYSQIQLFLCTAFAKISACLFLIRIVNKRPLIRFLCGLIAGLVIVNGAVTVMLVTQCRPLHKVWDTHSKGECWSITVVRGFGYAAASEFASLLSCTNNADKFIVFAVITDFLCSGLPIVFLWNVQIKGRTKVALCLLMSMGLL